MSLKTVTSPYSAKHDEMLMAEIWDPRIADDPLAFVMFCFPWKKAGTPLEDEAGPRKWQKKKLLEIKKFVAANNIAAINKTMMEIFQDATVSGRGVGKSALVAWLILWFMSTRLGSTTIVTANTEVQLKTRTWAELGRWHTLSINSHWFEKNTMALKPAPWFDEALKNQLQIDTGYYYAQAQLWSEENPDAFAGVHNPKGVLVIFDEASGIPASIWKVTKGFFTEERSPNRLWLVFSNGRRNTGAFFECFHKNRAFWRRTNIDGRDVEGTDKKLYADMVAEHGEDSDEVRVEVRGMFPKQGDKQFISRGLVEAAQNRELIAGDNDWAPLIMGVDPARYGDDQTVIRFRQGRDARSIPPVKMTSADNMAVANQCAELIQKFNPDAVCIDTGNGTGIIDRLREMGYKVHEVWFGEASPKDHPEWANFRTYMWAQMRDWLALGAIDSDPDLSGDLTSPEYKFMGTSDKTRLETKEELKDRGFSSPDNGDALACTFAVKIASRNLTASRKNSKNRRQAADLDYNMFG